MKDTFDSSGEKFAITHHLKDATEKVLILHKVVQDKVYLYVLRYYILYVKTVFQWRPEEVGVFSIEIKAAVKFMAYHRS